MTKFEKEQLFTIMANIDDVSTNLPEKLKEKYKKTFNKIEDCFYKVLMVNR